MFETDPTARHDELRTAGVDLVAIGGSKHEFEAEAVDKVIRGIGSGPHDFGTIVERAVLRKEPASLLSRVAKSGISEGIGRSLFRFPTINIPRLLHSGTTSMRPTGLQWRGGQPR